MMYLLRMGAKPRSGARYVAFLRGMNLGGRRISNEELVEHVAAMGLQNPQAFLASGNIIFDSPGSSLELEARLAAHLERSLHYPVPVFLRSRLEVMQLEALSLFADATSGGKPQIIFLRKPPPPAASRELKALAPKGETLVIREREIHWLPAGGLSESELDIKAIEKIAGTTTIRTENTVRRIAQRFL
jgi:uncharacterized protein (DUF1697 family)